MRNVIIGTAGHIDHGKSSLIRRLTGIDPDRWAEEKKRGITIDLGFSFFDLPSSKRVGIVDVPGHEKFIKNMLAGVSGIDLVLLVIALDEGIMPQTEEHLNILNLLKVQNGIIVLTKSDIVDEDMKELVKEDVTDYVKGTFLEDAPIVYVSSVTADGLDKLIQCMDDMVKRITFSVSGTDARLPIDRVFSLQGVGTVITGTLIEGEITENQQMELYPQNKKIRIRRIQNHNKAVKTAYGGQRIALNITGVEKDDISRGDIVATIASMRSTMMIDADLSLLASAPRPLDNWNRLRLYIGTKEVLCRVVILDKESVNAGDTALVQFRLEEPISCKYGDRFVIRSYSPLRTIGGGMILDAYAPKHKRFKMDIIDDLTIKKEGDNAKIIENVLLSSKNIGVDVEQIILNTGLEENIIRDILEQFEPVDGLQKACEIYPNIWMHMERFNDLKRNIEYELQLYHQNNPLSEGISKEELRKNKLPALKNKVVDAIFAKLIEDGHINIEGSIVSMPTFKISISDMQQHRADEIGAYFLEVGAKPPALSDVEIDLQIVKEDKLIISYLFRTGKLIQIDEKIWISGEVMNDIKRKLNSYFSQNNQISVAQFRDLVGTSRKNAIAILEYLDGIKFTYRKENVRIKLV